MSIVFEGRYDISIVFEGRYDISIVFEGRYYMSTIGFEGRYDMSMCVLQMKYFIVTLKRDIADFFQPKPLPGMSHRRGFASDPFSVEP